MYKYFLVCLLALAAAGAQAGTGLTQIPGDKGDGPVTVYYPSSAPDQRVQRGPFTFDAAPEGAAVRGNGHLIVISHGTGGAPWVHAHIARVMVEAGFVVAMPEHYADNYRNTSAPGPASYKRRPAEASRAIDAVAQDARFAPLLSFNNVGLYGFSAGGHTALSMAGGRWSPAMFRRHCEAHIAEDFPACVGLATRLSGGVLDGMKKTVALGVLRERFDDATWYTHDEPRIKAIVAGAPAAMDFDAESLAAPRVPLGLVTLGQDKWLAPRFHSGAILRACKSCEVVADLPAAGHGALLSPQPPMDVIPPVLADLIGDPPGFDRAALPEVDRKITAFFQKHLLP